MERRLEKQEETEKKNPMNKSLYFLVFLVYCILSHS
jgi:hypothetical protein